MTFKKTTPKVVEERDGMQYIKQVKIGQTWLMVGTILLIIAMPYIVEYLHIVAFSSHSYYEPLRQEQTISQNSSDAFTQVAEFEFNRQDFMIETVSAICEYNVTDLEPIYRKDELRYCLMWFGCILVAWWLVIFISFFHTPKYEGDRDKTTVSSRIAKKVISNVKSYTIISMVVLILLIASLKPITQYMHLLKYDYFESIEKVGQEEVIEELNEQNYSFEATSETTNYIEMEKLRTFNKRRLNFCLAVYYIAVILWIVMNMIFFFDISYDEEEIRIRKKKDKWGLPL